MELIDKQKAIYIASGYCHWSNIPKELKKLPAVQPRKKGHWEWITEDEYRCSVCRHSTRVDECMCKVLYEYCPYCGADLRGDDNE